MRITDRQLRKLIREWTKEEQEYAASEMRRVGPRVEFEWDVGGLAMGMYVNGQLVVEFMRQKQVEQLIKQLEDLLAGPMRTSP